MPFNTPTFVLLTLLVTAPLALSQNCSAIPPDNNDNPEYPEAAARCVHVTQKADKTIISATYMGPQFPTHETDPVCGSMALTVNCMRICGDLPKGKTPNASKVKQFDPGPYARWDKWEAFNKGDHWRVCFRTKNWANAGLNRGDLKTFTFEVPYKENK